LARLGSVAVYRDLFRGSCPDDVAPVSIANVARALAAFERTLIALNSPLDRFRRGEGTALSAAARRGLERFNALGCPRCHLGNLFTRANDPSTTRTELFVNTGLYNVGGSGAYPDRNGGLFETTRVPGDMGRMRVPSLRNVALTAPYGHDGSVATLEDVIDNYARGGRLVVSGPHAGDGRVSPWRDRRIEPLDLTAQDKVELVAFLNALTDSSLVNDRRFANPWR
jgi:cytochrome c peroxidase